MTALPAPPAPVPPAGGAQDATRLEPLVFFISILLH